MCIRDRACTSGSSLNESEIEERSETIVAEREQINIYPNPFRGQTTVEVQLIKESDLQIELYSLTGSSVKLVTSNQNMPSGTYQFPVDASHLDGGMYLLTIRINDRIQTQKLSIIK